MDTVMSVILPPFGFLCKAPACFRWELQPPANELIECGASVPLYGQSGGGVEVRFPRSTTNRCPIADPVLLPVM
jgi:hypothetical protein